MIIINYQYSYHDLSHKNCINKNLENTYLTDFKQFPYNYSRLHFNKRNGL